MSYQIKAFGLQFKCFYSFVAQWLEQGTHKPKVAGSSPAKAKANGEMAEWSKAADC